MSSNTDRVERRIRLSAPRSRVWRALTNPVEFGEWFGVKFGEASFVAGRRIKGNITYPGYEHVSFDVLIESIEPEQRFSWRWHPYAVERDVDYSHEKPTLVEFELHDVDGGTLLTVIESGFDNVPPSRRLEAFRMNSGGWDEQIINIQKHVAKK
jgi:uncharacterized protein YndB with AHSA1/START domain